MSTTDIIGEFRIGSDITVGIAAKSGDVNDVTSIEAALRRMTRAGSRFVFVATDPGTAMTVTARAAAGDVPAGWNFGLAAASTAAMEPGFYGIDALLTMAGGTIKTKRTAPIELSEAAL